MTDWDRPDYSRTFEYIDGDLSELEEAEFSEALNSDPRAAAWVGKLSDMVREARGRLDSPDDEVVAETTRMNIVAQLGIAARPTPPKSRVWLAAAAIIAGCAIGVTALASLSSNAGSSQVSFARLASAVSEASKPAYRTVVPPRDHLSNLVAIDPALWDLPDEVTVFGSRDAVWRTVGEHDLRVIHEEGTLLFEYVPTDNQTMTVLTPHASVVVVGTVFSVDVAPDHTTVWVLSGAVDVLLDTRFAIRVESGFLWDSSTGALSPILRHEAASVDQWIDIEEHEVRLQALASALDRQGSQPVESEAVVSRPRRAPSRSALDRAHQKVLAEEYEDAARFFELALNGAEPSIQREIRLELAWLYLTHLERPEAALPHLDALTQEFPNDRAVRSAVARACRDQRIRNLFPICEE